MRAVVAKLIAIVVFVVLAPIGVQGAERAAERPVIRVYNWEDYIPPELLRRFEETTGIRVEYSTYGSTEELVTNVANNPGRYDVIVPSSYTVAYLRGKGMLAPLDKTRIPNIRNLDPMFMSPTFDPGSRYCVAYLWSKLVLGYNSSRVSRPLQSWTEIFEPRFSGRVALLTDSRESLGVVLLMLGFSPNTTDPTEIAKARDFLISRNRHIHSYADDSGEDLLDEGKVDIALSWEGDMAALTARRPDLRYVVPIEGSVVATDSMCIPATSRNKVHAARFIDFVLDAEMGALLASEVMYPTPNLAAQARLPESARARQKLSEDMKTRLFPLADVGNAALSLYDDAWEKILENHRGGRRARK